MARFDAQQFLELVARHRVAWVNVVPTMLHRIWQLPDAAGARPTSPRCGAWSRAEPLRAWLMRAGSTGSGPDRVFEPTAAPSASAAR